MRSCAEEKRSLRFDTCACIRKESFLGIDLRMKKRSLVDQFKCVERRAGSTTLILKSSTYKWSLKATSFVSFLAEKPSFGWLL